MIQFDKVFEVFRNVIKYRLEPIIARQIKVIQVRTTGAKPKEVFATMDIMFIDDKNSYLTNSWYDSANQEMVYETHKSVRLQLGVRNGNPDNLQDQMDVYTLCNHLHKAFTEEAILGYIHDYLGATVTSVLAVRTLSDFLPTGVGNIQAFDILIGMNDVTRTTNAPIENVEIGGSVGGEDIDIDVTNPPVCSGLTMTQTTGELDVSEALSNYTFEGTGLGTFVVDNPDVPVNTAFLYSFSNADGNSVSISIGSETYEIQHELGRTSVTLDGLEIFAVEDSTGEIPFVVNTDIHTTNHQYIASTKNQVNQFVINRVDFKDPSRLIFYKNDLVGKPFPSDIVDVCGNSIG